MVLNHYKESRSHQDPSHQLVLMNRQKKIEIQSNEAQDEQERDMNSKPRRAQGGKGLLSRSISVQNPQESIPLIPREEREEGKRGEGGGGGTGLAARAKERERGRGGI